MISTASSAPRALRRAAVGLAACAAIVVPVTGLQATGAHASTQATTTDSNGVAWPADSVVNNKLGANPALDPNSSTIVQHMVDWTAGQGGKATWYSYSGSETSNPLVRATASDPTWDVQVTGSDTKSSYLKKIHAPADIASHIATGPDHQLAIYGVDGETDLWEASVDATHHIIHADNGGRIPDTSTDAGISFPVNGAYNSASGLSQEALTLTPQEVRAAMSGDGYVHHPLMMAMPGVFENGRISKPAIASDSWSGGIAKNATNISIGQRLQLDPGLDVSKLNQPTYTKVIEKTLQVEGAIVTDSTSQANDVNGIFNVALENPLDFTSKGQANPWTAIYASDNNPAWKGDTEDWTVFTGCYGHCDALPVGKLRVLAEDYMAPAAATTAPVTPPVTKPTQPTQPTKPVQPTSPSVGTASSWAGAESNTSGMASTDTVKYIVNTPTITPAMVGKTLVVSTTGKTGVGTPDAKTMGIHYSDATGWHDAKLSGAPIVTGATAGVKTPITAAMVGHQVQLYGHVSTTAARGTAINLANQVVIGSGSWVTSTSYTVGS